MKEIIVTGATIEDALANGCQQLEVDADSVEYEVLEQPQQKILGIFGGSPAKLRVYTKETPSSVAIAYLTDILTKMGVHDLVITEEVTDKRTILNIDGNDDDLGVVIGHRGDTLTALQYLVSLAANTACDGYFKVALNVKNFREKREKTLETVASKTAYKAVKLQKNIALEPMSPYERSIIHTAVQAIDGVTSWSVGENERRHVVIGPEGLDEVISAELLPYLLVRKIGHLAHHIHRHLSGLGNLRGALGRFDILGGHFKGAGDFFDDAFDCDRRGLHVVHHVADGVLRHGQRGKLFFQLIGRVDALDDAFELTDVGFQALGDEFRDFVAHLHIALLGLALDNGNSGFKFRGLNIREQTHLKAGAQAVFQRLNLSRGTVAGEDNLLMLLMKGIEGVEEFLLRLFLASDKLYVVHHEHVDIAVFLMEFVLSALPYRVDQLVGELIFSYKIIIPYTD